MADAWAQVEPTVWDASGVISFYETASGESFPEAIRDPFTKAVAQLGLVPQLVNRIPGLEKTQAVAGEGLRAGTKLAKDGFRRLKRMWA